MTCNQLGGACETPFQAETFQEMTVLSQLHGTEMFEAKDEPHLAAMEEMMEMMSNPEAMQKWMEEKEALFNSLPEDK